MGGCEVIIRGKKICVSKLHIWNEQNKPKLWLYSIPKITMEHWRLELNPQWKKYWKPLSTLLGKSLLSPRMGGIHLISLT